MIVKCNMKIHWLNHNAVLETQDLLSLGHSNNLLQVVGKVPGKTECAANRPALNVQRTWCGTDAFPAFVPFRQRAPCSPATVEPSMYFSRRKQTPALPLCVFRYYRSLSLGTEILPRCFIQRTASWGEEKKIGACDIEERTKRSGRGKEACRLCFWCNKSVKEVVGLVKRQDCHFLHLWTILIHIIKQPGPAS